MLQSSSTSSADKDDNRTTESLSQLRVKICSVRLPSSSKLVDIGVIMEVDNKYTYRTEIIRKKGKTNTNTNANSPIIIVNESFDVLVTSNSKIKLKVLAPTRLFGNHDIGQLQFSIKSIINDYHSSEQIDNNNNNNNDTTPSYLVKLPFDNSTTIRSNDINNLSNGIVEIIFYGSLLKQQQQNNENRNQQNAQQVDKKNHFYDFSLRRFFFLFFFLSFISFKDTQQLRLTSTHSTVENGSESSNEITPQMILTSIRSRRRPSNTQTNGTIPEESAAAAAAVPDGQTNSSTDQMPVTNEARIAQLKQQVCLEKN
jgi:hypothetical protein